MIGINGKDWMNIQCLDVQAFLLSDETNESFFFEFKDDSVKNSQIAKEISAMSNTYGGYIFLGISDEKRVLGCTEWNEERITSVVHDSITPIPIFDVKTFYIDGSRIIVIKIEEGGEPPYITSQGEICERVSSASCKITDSNKLGQLFYKNEKNAKIIQEKLTIPPLDTCVDNVYGYIDIGFQLVLSKGIDTSFLLEERLMKLAKEYSAFKNGANLLCFGESIVITPGGISIRDSARMLPAHLNNFMEIIRDGSVRMRVLLHNNDSTDPSVNFFIVDAIRRLYRDVYFELLGGLILNDFLYAKKYEAIKVIKQFQPAYYFDEKFLSSYPVFQDVNERIIEGANSRRRIMGVDMVVTDDRIPKTGLKTIDRRMMESRREEYTTETIMNELFRSGFLDSIAPNHLSFFDFT